MVTTQREGAVRTGNVVSYTNVRRMVRSAVLAVAIFALAPQLVGAQSAEPAMTSSPVRIVSVDGAFSLPGGV